MLVCTAWKWNTTDLKNSDIRCWKVRTVFVFLCTEVVLLLMPQKRRPLWSQGQWGGISSDEYATFLATNTHPSVESVQECGPTSAILPTSIAPINCTSIPNHGGSCKGNAYSIRWVTNWPEIREHDYPLCAWLFIGLGTRALGPQFTHEMCGVVASYIVFGTHCRSGDSTWFYSVCPENAGTVHWQSTTPCMLCPNFRRLTR